MTPPETQLLTALLTHSFLVRVHPGRCCSHTSSVSTDLLKMTQQVQVGGSSRRCRWEGHSVGVVGVEVGGRGTQ